MSGFMQVAIYGKKIEEDFLPIFKKLVALLQERGCRLCCEENFAGLLEKGWGYVPGFSEGYGKERALPEDTDMLLSIGGDGTFLDSVVYVKEQGIPVLGVNSGRLGFLANVRTEEIERAVDCIVAGDYATEQREVLHLEVDGKEEAGFDTALNEVCVLKTSTSSLLKIHAYIGEEYLTTYWADGLIVATPTGSTAYSLSGGGPIVSPVCRNIILTPVCPHNLSMRPLVLPNDACIRLEVESRSGDFMLSMDSRTKEMSHRYRLAITMGKSRIKVVRLPFHSYYETLRNKLMWGEDRRNDGIRNMGGRYGYRGR